MRIKWSGPGTRVRCVGPWVWNQANGFVCEVEDAEAIATLLTEKDGLFNVDYSDPLLKIKGLTPQRVEELAILANVVTVEGLAHAEVGTLMRATGSSEKQAKAWIEAAQLMAEPPVHVQEED